MDQLDSGKSLSVTDVKQELGIAVAMLDKATAAAPLRDYRYGRNHYTRSHHVFCERQILMTAEKPTCTTERIPASSDIKCEKICTLTASAENQVLGGKGGKSCNYMESARKSQVSPMTTIIAEADALGSPSKGGKCLVTKMFTIA